MKMMEKKEQTTNKTKHTDTHKLESQSKVTIDGALGGWGGGGSSKRCNTTVGWSPRCFCQRAKPLRSSQRGPSNRRGRAPAALSQGVSVTSKPAAKGCFSSSHEAKRRRQSAEGREGGRERSHALQPQWPHCSNSD